MAKKRKVSNAVKRAPGGYTTLPVGEEGIPSLQIAENPPSTITAELGPIFNPGGPVEQPVAKAVKAKAARKRRT